MGDELVVAPAAHVINVAVILVCLLGDCSPIACFEVRQVAEHAVGIVGLFESLVSCTTFRLWYEHLLYVPYKFDSREGQCFTLFVVGCVTPELL